jgi:hypothetical protein
MSFDITTDDRGLVPLLMCWECNAPIMDMNMGIVLWHPAHAFGNCECCDEDLGVSEPAATILHKGECARKFEAINKAVGSYPHSMELTQFFEAWFQGAQFQSYDRRDAQRRLEMMRSLGES